MFAVTGPVSVRGSARVDALPRDQWESTFRAQQFAPASVLVFGRPVNHDS
jgi:hypothetical protein